MSEIAFRPRRLGHVNLYVSQLERSMDFYERTCGIERVRIEAAIRGGFHSNGNTHHDIGLMEVSKGVDRRGRDGTIQIAATRGTSVGLNHLGWEMENEAELIAAYKRLRHAGTAPQRASDHLISHSVYLPDPDGNMHEFYADVVEDWRQIFNLDHDDLVTSAWDPLEKSPLTKRYYPTDPAIRHVQQAPLHPRSITGATVATHSLSQMEEFFVSVAGLTPILRLRNGREQAIVFAGAVGRPDLTLVEVGKKERTGLRMFSFQIQPDAALETALTQLAEASAAMKLGGDDDRRSVVLSDPDGFRVEFYWPRSGKPLPPSMAA
jgi:catechol 2,3-dioxygenase